MHELSIVQGLYRQVEAIARQYGARRVMRLVVEVGEFSNVVPELLQSAFEAFQMIEPLLAETTLEMRVLPLKLNCESCGCEFQPSGYRFTCPVCESGDVKVLRGEELRLCSVELEKAKGVPRRVNHSKHR